MGKEEKEKVNKRVREEGEHMMIQQVSDKVRKELSLTSKYCTNREVVHLAS